MEMNKSAQGQLFWQVMATSAIYCGSLWVLVILQSYRLVKLIQHEFVKWHGGVSTKEGAPGAFRVMPCFGDERGARVTVRYTQMLVDRFHITLGKIPA